MQNNSIAPRRLLQDSLTTVAPIYVSVLLFFIPALLLALLGFVIPPTVSSIIVWIYSLSLGQFLTSAAIFYVYQRLTRKEATVYESLQKATKKLPQLVLVLVLEFLILIPAFVLLIIPGIYLSVRLAFAIYVLMIENRSAADALNRSWQLVKKRWWSVFWALLVHDIAVFVPIMLISIIIGTIFGVSPIALFLGIAGSNPAYTIDLIVSTIFVFLIGPVIITYQVFLFMRLLALEKRKAVLV